MEKGLHNVRDIYLDGIVGGNIRDAVTITTGHRYTQHSAGVADGVEWFLEFFEPFVQRYPKSEIEIVRIFEDGTWVFCNALQALNDGDAKWATMDMFYTDRDGLILEHWDTIKPYVQETALGAGMVAGTSEVDTSANTTASKSLVLEFTKQVLQEHGPDKIPDFLADDIVQHAATIGAGHAGMADWLNSDAAGSYEMMFQLIGQGDFVVTYGKRHAGGKDIAVSDLYLVAADPSAIPVAAATLEAMPRDANDVAIFEITSDEDRQTIDMPQGIDVHWLIQPDPHTASTAQEALIRSSDWSEGRVQTSIAGESSVSRSLRAFLAQKKNLPHENVYCSGNWKIGLIEDQHQKAKRANS
ncbi:MAG: SIP domain-containing protein [Paracoccaceae bacterium]